MRPHLALVTGIDPQVTRRFLLAQPSVIDAAVWYQRGRLHAEVAVADTKKTDPSTLRQLCAAALGQLQAPKEITLVNVLPAGGNAKRAAANATTLYEAA